MPRPTPPRITPAHATLVSGDTITFEVEHLEGPLTWELLRIPKGPTLGSRESKGRRISLCLKARGELSETYFLRAWSQGNPGEIALTSVRVLPLKPSAGPFEALIDNLFPQE